MKPNKHKPGPSEPPAAPRARARHERAREAEVDSRMATNLEWEARFGAIEPLRREFARRLAAILRKTEP